MSKTIKDNWRLEDRFRRWGKPLKKTGDDFIDWANQVRKEYEEENLEAELRDLFLAEIGQPVEIIERDDEQ